jgi:hypothetical protein
MAIIGSEFAVEPAGAVVTVDVRGIATAAVVSSPITVDESPVSGVTSDVPASVLAGQRWMAADVVVSAPSVVARATERVVAVLPVAVLVVVVVVPLVESERRTAVVPV